MRDWAYLNEEGITQFGEIFPNHKVPIISILPISFEHPDFEDPQTAYILNGKELAEETIQKLIMRLAEKFNETPTEYPALKQEILENRIPVRVKITSGVGTSRPQMYVMDEAFEGEEEE